MKTIAQIKTRTSSRLMISLIFVKLLIILTLLYSAFDFTKTIESITNEEFINEEASKIEIRLNTETTEQLQKSKMSLQRLIEEHAQKLIDYKNNPDEFDNKNKLKDIDKNIRDKIINGRIQKLEKEIEKFRKLIEKIDKKLIEKHGN